MPRNVPVSLANPDTPTNNADHWLELGKLAKANPEFTAIEIKAFYVVGLIDDICQSVAWLLKAEDAWPEKYLPAFGVFASGVDLLERCITGNSTPRVKENLAVGFYYLARPTLQPPVKSLPPTEAETTIVVKTNMVEYSVADLVALRHYSAHGQATTKNRLPSLHIELLDQFPQLIGNAMEAYWSGLKGNEEFCSRLGSANVAAYSNRAEPLRHTLEYFSKPDNSIDGLFIHLDWQVCK
jgi:hypothetical protein